MKHSLSLKASLIAGFLICSNAFGALWNYSGSGAWAPPTTYLGDLYTPSALAYPIEAIASESPLQITLKIYSTPTPSAGANTNISGTYDIYRKDPWDGSWGSPIGTVTVGTSIATWVDTNVVVGQVYEYGLASAGTTTRKLANVMAGIKADRTQPRGRVALVVANDIPAQLPSEFAQFKADLVEDGWVIHEIPVARAKDYHSNGAGANDALGIPTGPFPSDHIAIRNQIIALYQDAGNQYPGLPLRNVILLGKVPVVRSGMYYNGPDGHGNVSSQGTDAYYADMDGDWKDEKSNFHFTWGYVSSFINNPDGTVTPPAGVTIDAAFLSNLRVTYASTSGSVYVVDPSGKYIVSVNNGRVGSTGYKTIPGFTNNPDGTVTLPRGVIIDQAVLAEKRALGSGTFFVTNYMFMVTGGNVTAIGCTSYTDSGVAVDTGRLNVPGDNKYDADEMSQILTPNSNVELGYGRIDLSNNVPGEYEAVRMYLNKLHRYKTASPDFLPGRKAIYRPQFGMVTKAYLAGMPSLLGMKNLDFIVSSDLPAVPTSEFDSDSAYTAQVSPYLFYFKGSGGPGYSAGGRAVFWTGMQSHWGYWFADSITSGSNAMQRRLAEDNYCLSFTWSIGGLGSQLDANYLYYRMGMGFDAGDMMRVSISNRSSASSLYVTARSPLFMAHMGDPTLRLFMFPPPTDLSITRSGDNASLSWVASRAPAVGEPQVIGYHVYRAAVADGIFSRVTSTPTVDTTYLDSTVSSGTWIYQVKAVRLETTGGGTYYNTSLGVQQTIDLSNSPAAPTITSNSLPDAQWNTPYEAALNATGGTPVFNWTVISGALPPGLTLSNSGIISGLASAGGTYAFTVEATDQAGQTTQKVLLINVQSEGAETFFAEANTYMTGYNSTKWSFYSPSLSISGPVYLYQPFLRFDISGLVTSNAFVRAKLILTLDERSQANSYALIKAALTQDAGDAWTESAVTWATRPLDDTTVPQAYASSFPVAYGTIELDVTDQVRATLANDPAKKVGLRLYTTRNNGFGSEVRFATRYASGNARPRLVIETTNAPAITIISPSVNPASIAVGSSLMINATATAIPAQTGSLSVQWSKSSGPGTVTFGTPTQASSTASFSSAGDYVLRLVANDGLLTSTKDLTVRVYNVPSGTTPITGPAFDPSLILRLPFDETTGTTAADVSGVSPAHASTLATVGGTGLPAWVSSGKLGGAINFDGAGQRVETNDSATAPLDGMQKLTASLWVKLNAEDANSHAILVKRTSSTSSTTSYAITLSSTEKVSVSVANKTAVVGDTTLAVGQWYHVVMLFDGSLATNNMQLYINGNPDKFGAMTTGLTDNKIPLTPASKLRVGDYTATALGGTSLGFNGQVDEVRLYNRALSIDEIQVLAQAKPANMGPAILAPASVTGEAGQAFALNATATDDGQPSPLLVGWNNLAGPGSLIFADAAAATTTATPSLAGNYTLRLSASDGAIVTFADVLASISEGSSPPTFAQWAESHGLPNDGTGLGAPDSTPANDGISNTMKYALGIDPHVSGYQGHLVHGTVSQSGQTYLSITYIRPEPQPAGVSYAVQSCGDLSGWSTLATEEVSSTPGTPTTGLRTVIVRDTLPMSDPDARRFIQLEVTTP